MAKSRSGFSVPGFTAYVDRVKNVVTQEAAQLIVDELQDEGPAYTGEFRNAWVVLTGAGRRIKARKDSKYGPEERLEFANKGPETLQRVKVPKQKGRSSNGYTIGNTMKYRNIALDLEPGRVEKGKNNSAPQDWYVKFVEGGRLKDILEAATLKAAKDPKIRGFDPKNLNDARGRLGL